MTVCRYFTQGSCKFGPRCNFEHPRDGGGQQFGRGAFGNVSTSFNNPKTGGSTSGASASGSDASEYQISVEDIRRDLTTDKPLWPLTSYCPIKNGSANLINNQDISFEELRVSAYQALNGNTMQQYQQELDSRFLQITNQINAVLGNLAGALKISREMNQKAPSQAPSTFPGNSSPASTVFGQPQPPSAFSAAQTNTTASPFGQTPNNHSAFGAPSMPTAPVSAFASSAFPAKPAANNPFAGQNSLTTAFPSASPSGTSSSAFTQQSAFGSSSFGQSAFGSTNPSGSNGTLPFGQTTSTNGVNSSNPSGAFQTSTGAFGASAPPVAAQPLFGSSGFAQNGFNTTNSAPATTNPFAASTSAFRQPAQASSQVSAFGSSSSQASTLQPQPGGMQQTAFGSSAPPPVIGSDQESAYTKIEDLRPSDLAEFRAAAFTLDKIPEVPPPRDLIR